MEITDQTYGLVVAGGQSVRMGVDKSFLNYHGIPQLYFMYHLMKPLFNKVIISCNSSQEFKIDKEYLFITDKDEFSGRGPVSALLTAFSSYPGHNFMVTGSDYPFLTGEVLESFLNTLGNEKKPVVFYNEKHELYEPLIGWYPYRSFPDLYERYKKGQFSLQAWLKDIQAKKYKVVREEVIFSVDTPQQYEQTREIIRNAIEKKDNGKRKSDEI